MSEEQISTSGKFNRKKWEIIGAILIILIAIIIGISIYNTPKNRLLRQIDLGQRYLEEQNYEQAIVEFDKAIAIDPMNADAYLGKAQAYEGMGDFEQALETLWAGCEQTGDEQIWEATGSCLESYLERLIGEGRYDEAEVLIKKYRDKVQGVDFQKYLNEIGELRTAVEIEELRANIKVTEEEERQNNEVFLDNYEVNAQNIYKLMIIEDYYSLYNILKSEEMKAFGSEMQEDYYLYFPDTNNDNQTGIGVGIYKHSQWEYSIYYGDYNRGNREGMGTLLYLSSGCAVFTGQWSQDAPNGQGVLINDYYIGNNDASLIETRRGNLVNGLWDGEVNIHVRDNEKECNMSFTAINGLPVEDMTEKYIAETGDYELMNETNQGTHYLIAYYRSYGFAQWRYAQFGKTMGIIGFADDYFD